MVTGQPCRQCGVPITRRWQHELRNAVFCSDSCKVAYQAQHPTNFHGALKMATCKVCGKEFTYYPSVRPTAAYCSNECRSAGQGEKVSGKKSGNWKGETRGKVTARSLAKRYFPRRCVICGWHEASVDAHHIHPLKSGGKNLLSNIIILCPNHHRLADELLLSEKELDRQWHLAYDSLSLPTEFL